MLLSRLLTALILIPIVLWGILTFSPPLFALVAGGLFLLGANEWSGFCGFTTLLSKITYIVVVAALMGVLYLSKHPFALLLIGTLLWIFPVVWVLFYQPERFRYLNHNAFRAVLGLLVLSFAWYSLVILRSFTLGPIWLIVLCVLVWSTDIFAYFAGRKWGKAKLCPLISPGKTKAGFWGGLGGSLLMAALIFAILEKELLFSKPSFFVWDNLLLWLGIACLTILLAVIGDLFESLMKRLAGVKDSGRLLPGHGGVLDRIDSLISTLPVYTFLILWVMR